MVKFLLESSKKWPLLNIDHPFKNGNDKKALLVYSRSSYASFYLAWNLWERFYSNMQKIRILAAPYFRNFESSKIRNNESAPGTILNSFVFHEVPYFTK